LEYARGNLPHNVLLAVLAETGLVGLGLFLALLGLWTRDAWRLWRDPTAPLWVRQPGLLFLATLAAYLTNGAFHHVAFIPMSNTLLFFLAGVTAAWRSAAPDRQSPSPGPG
jgi:O-antigen ligase